ncbi:phosphatidylglycerophosphatase A family protein [Atopomonas sediminilitoris]|uniref:phosphatidylglycerophosphatase A family protein n=1 Tax=Atopomonas sediminilitoris TaxID=2919919 RepID=UPI001F4E0B36|nr:phosphatidylglycerophosphatase A [Atopomonas sediminilitoris]MCJ8170210.1 phosphatidylglycerophosphatase A [Atopomonas sediminilitoris]
MTETTPASVWRNPWHFLAFGLGSGAMPKAPGTWGTLMALPFGIALQWLSPWLAGLLILLAAIFGIWLCERVSRDLGVHDHGGIVWDEFVGLWITLWLAPAHWLVWLAAFALFRLIDILKPWPISWCDREVHGGLGIMLDDVLAGVAAWALLQLGLWWAGYSLLI